MSLHNSTEPIGAEVIDLPRVLHDATLLGQAAGLIEPSPNESYCDEHCPGTPFNCTREPHADETHVSHHEDGHPVALWPLESFAILGDAP